MQKILIATEVNLAPEEKINQKIAELGGDWKVVSAVTTTTIFGYEVGSRIKTSGNREIPLHHAIYTITIIVEKIS